MRSHAHVQGLVVLRVRPAGPLPAPWVRAAVADSFGQCLGHYFREFVSHSFPTICASLQPWATLMNNSRADFSGNLRRSDSPTPSCHSMLSFEVDALLLEPLGQALLQCRQRLGQRVGLIVL